jgi:putative aldouronate transport system substrate-binding protein
MKKILIICLMVLLIGCNEVSNETVTGYTYDEPLILTMYSEDIKKEDVGFNNPVAEEIARLTGVRMDTQYPVENVSDKIDLMVNSGDYPDLIMVKDTHKMVDAGAYIDLAPLIEAHGPNIKKLYEDYFGRLKFSEEDPAIYVLPTAPVDTVNYKPVQGFKLQHAVVKALGYPKMDILKDFEKAIKDYMEMYPEIDGEKTIGISFVMEDWRWKVTVGNSGGFTTGVPDDGNWYIDPETYEATYRLLRPEEKE